MTVYHRSGRRGCGLLEAAIERLLWDLKILYIFNVFNAVSQEVLKEKEAGTVLH